MKRAVPILIFILILILRQAPSALIEDQGRGSCSNHYALNLFSGAQGFGWLEIMENGDPGVLSPVFGAFQSEDKLFLGEAPIRPIRNLSHCFANPLLIDRPPPFWKAELIDFA